MKSFLKSLQGFAHSMGGLVVVIVLAVWQTGLYNLLVNPFPAFTMSVVGGWLSTILVAFAIIWAQYKERVLLSHALLFLVFANGLSTFLSGVLTLNFDQVLNVNTLVNLVGLLYVFAVVVAELMFSKPKPAAIAYKDLLSIGLFALAVYIHVGFTGALLALLPVFVALFLGSKVVAFLYATASLIGSVFGQLNWILTTPEEFSHYVYFALFAVALVFVVLDLLKAFKNNEA